VKWDKHEQNMIEAFQRQRKEGHPCELDFDFDLTLACEDHQLLQAHKIVLSAGSSFFEKILERYKHPSPLIYLRGVQSNQMELLMDLMYSGEAIVGQDMLESFLVIGGELGVKGLVNTSSCSESAPEETKQASFMREVQKDLSDKNLQQSSTNAINRSLSSSKAQGICGSSGDPKEPIGVMQAPTRGEPADNNLLKEGQVVKSSYQLDGLGAITGEQTAATDHATQNRKGSEGADCKQSVQVTVSKGKMQVRGLLPGQKLVRTSDGKLIVRSANGQQSSLNLVKKVTESRVAKSTLREFQPVPGNAAPTSVDIFSSGPEVDFSTIKVSTPRSVNNNVPTEDEEANPANESLKILVKSEEVESKTGSGEDAMKIKGIASLSKSYDGRDTTIGEWKDLRKFMTIIVEGVGGSGGKGKRIFKCAVCERIMGQKESMMRHIESKHFRGILNHTCTICQKSFQTRNTMEQHKHREHK